MFRFFIILGLLFLSILAFYSTRNDTDSNPLQLRSLTDNSDVSIDENKSEIPEISKTTIVDSGAKDKTLLKEVSLDVQDIEQLKLNDFHAYLRHEERVANQKDGSVSVDILDPEQRKEIAKERLAVRLIEKLNSKKEK